MINYYIFISYHCFGDIPMKKYTKPPLITASCEINVSRDENTKWNKVYIGELYARLKEDYPNNEDVISTNGQFIPERGNYEVEQFPETKLYIENDKDNRSLFVSEKRLKVNCNRPYPGWEIFGKKINTAISEYQTITKPKAIEEIALIYTNKISIPIAKETVFNENEYFTVVLDYSSLGTLAARMDTRLVFPQENKNFMVMSFSILPNQRTNSFDCYIEIAYIITKQNLKTATEIEKYINLAHEAIEKCFENTIKDKTRSFFNA